MKLTVRRSLRIIFLFAVFYFLITFFYAIFYNIFILKEQRQIAFNPSDQTFAVPNQGRAKFLALITKTLSLPFGPYFAPKDLPVDLPVMQPIPLLLNSIIWGIGGFLIFVGLSDAFGRKEEVPQKELEPASGEGPTTRRGVGIRDVFGISIAHFLLTFLFSILQLREHMTASTGKGGKEIWSVIAEAFRVPVTPLFVDKEYWYESSNLGFNGVLMTAGNSLICGVVIVSLVYAAMKVLEE